MADAASMFEPSADLLKRSDTVGLRHLAGHLLLLCATGGTVAGLSYVPWTAALAGHGAALSAAVL